MHPRETRGNHLVFIVVEAHGRAIKYCPTYTKLKLLSGMAVNMGQTSRDQVGTTVAVAQARSSSNIW